MTFLAVSLLKVMGSEDEELVIFWIEKTYSSLEKPSGVQDWNPEWSGS